MTGDNYNSTDAYAPEPEDFNSFRDKHSGSGVGMAIAMGTTITAAVASSAVFAVLHVPVVAMLVVGAGLGLLAGGLVINQQRKETKNQYHAYCASFEHKGYTREMEYKKDESLLHMITGPSDLPARVSYLERTLGTKLEEYDKFRDRNGGLGLGAGILTALAVTAISIPLIASCGIAALALTASLGALAGGTVMAYHNAETMRKYDAYVDGVAESAGKKEPAAGKAAEYDNGRDRSKTFAAQLAASRQLPAETGVSP